MVFSFLKKIFNNSENNINQAEQNKSNYNDFKKENLNNVKKNINQEFQTDLINNKEVLSLIGKYYKNKSDLFKSSISEYIYISKTKKGEKFTENEINRLTTRSIEKKLSLEQKNENDLKIRFLNDVILFKKYFENEGLVLKYNDLYSVFGYVKDQHIEKATKKRDNELCERIRSVHKSKNVLNTVDNIIDTYIFLNEINREGLPYEEDLFQADVRIELPRILQKFGHEFDPDSDLYYLTVNQVIKKRNSEFAKRSIMNSIDMSYDEDILQNDAIYTRQPIPVEVKREVWRRDEGMCSKCGSRENLEYDHIIPVSKGGSNTVRNIELLCQNCNRIKSNNIS
jgi:hypothetical protein